MSDFNVPGSRPKKHDEISEIDRNNTNNNNSNSNNNNNNDNDNNDNCYYYCCYYYDDPTLLCKACSLSQPGASPAVRNNVNFGP